MSTVGRSVKFFSGLFSDKSLTKKAYLNAITVVLEYAASLLVGFLITPLMVTGLGNYFFGLWQVLNRLVGYINPASGRPAFALKATLANQQASTDYDQKRRYVGSTLLIWLLFLPFLISVGGIVSWFVPYWIQASAADVWVIRTVAGLLVANLIIGSLSSVPQSTLQGENLGYKRMGMSVLLVFVGGSFTWLALHFGTGIVGVAFAAVAFTFANGLFFLWVVKNYARWFGMARPRPADVRQLLGLSWWFMGWNLVTNLLLASDVVVLGFLHSVESVTNYSLTKYVPETLIGIIVIIIFGIVPGLGRIIGTGDHEKAIRLRSEINSFIWLIATTLGASILLWNRVFVTLWVGVEHYAGTLPNLLIVIAAMQLVFIRSDGNIIDLTLRMSQKVLLGFAAVILSIAAASLLVGYFRLGIAGLCVGIMAGRSILSLGYPRLIGRFLGAALSSQLSGILRPALVTILLFSLSIAVDSFLSPLPWAGAKGWFLFLLSAGITGLGTLVLSFYAGLSSAKRGIILSRVRGVLTTAESM